MKSNFLTLAAGLMVFSHPMDLPGGQSPGLSPREALQPFGILIGKWKGTGEPKGPSANKADFWIEFMDREWQFKGHDAWLKVAFEKGRFFTGGELRFHPQKNHFELQLKTINKDNIVFTGTIKDRLATFDRTSGEEVQRLVFNLLHENRILYRQEVRPAGKTLFTQTYRVGATKEGVPFAGADDRPECIVSGGLGTTPVSFQGQTYYVCCSGCRDEFNANPKKYVDEYIAKKAKNKKAK